MANHPAFDVFALTNVGFVREQNEDAMFVSDDGLVIAVADGMGGHVHGELASKLAVQAIEQMCRTESPSLLSPDDHADWVDRACEAANESIYKHGERHPHTSGMGTTLVIAVMDDLGGAIIGNVGDSRAMIVAPGWSNTITQDHADYDHQGRGGLTRYLGRDYLVEADVFSTTVHPGQTLLLCTDGLHGVISPKEIIQLVSDSDSAESCCDALIESALEYGGPDNITVIAWRRN